MIQITEQGKSGDLYEFAAKSLLFGCFRTMPQIGVGVGHREMEILTIDEAEQVALHLLALVETAKKREVKE